MRTTIDAPEFLTGVITPGAYTEDDRHELRDLAVRFLIDNQRLQRAADAHRMHYLLHVIPAIQHAADAGWDPADIHADADRTYGQWLIDNAGQ